MSLQVNDKELYDLIMKETNRQNECIELIASENYTSNDVMMCLGSVLTNKYSEGQIGKRYYGGNKYIDMIEQLCKDRAMEAFHLNEEWNVNVQSYSGSPANFAVYTALLNPGDRILGLELQSGGHLTHGYRRGDNMITVSSKYFETESYKVNNEGYIDMDDVMMKAMSFKPNIIIVGASAYSRDYDYAQFREIANKCGAILMADISHISGFIATQLMNNPFEYCDVVTTTTHKTLRGPRAALIFSKSQYSNPIDNAVFPGLQGGPHNNAIAAIATQLKQVTTTNFKNYMWMVRNNARVLSNMLQLNGFKVLTDGTDNHTILLDLSNFGVTGSKFERVCELAHISLNKNSVPGDKSMLSPSGVRIGTSSITTRNVNMDGLDKIADWLYRCLLICINRMNIYGKKLKEWSQNIENDINIISIRNEVIMYSKNTLTQIQHLY